MVADGTEPGSATYLIDDPDQSGLTADVFDGDCPQVSFCVPTLNDAETLETTLQSVRAQSYPTIEVVVVDGGSDDGTREIAARLADTVVTDEGLLGRARQTGVENSSGEVIALFDGDVVLPHEEWLAAAVRRFDYDESVSTVWPRNVAPPDAPPLTRLYFEHWELMMERRMRTGRGYLGGGNSLFRRDHLEAVGGVSRDLHWGEDFDWAKRLAEAGYSVVYHRDPVYHDTMRSLGEFMRKQFVGAETFTDTGFGLMGLTLGDVLYEQYALGLYGMVRGLLLDREPAWLLYPPYIGTRTLAYGKALVERRLGR